MKSSGCIAVLVMSGLSVLASGQTLTTLHTFSGTDGAAPGAGLTLGPDGKLYGTTYGGGTASSGGAYSPFGTVFVITPAGTLTTLYNFAGNDGANPYGLLAVGSDGNFYGTTYNGGAANEGTVFCITPTGTLNTLYSFAITDGANPVGGLTLGQNGNFYGTTSAGGVNGDGTVFMISPSTGALTTLYNFSGADGSFPYASLTLWSDGNFYGTTANGGANNYYGTAFQITPTGSLNTLYSFGFVDGSGPFSSLTAANGILYGATSNGGANVQYGNIFTVTSTGGFATPVTFSGGNGAVPVAGLTLGTNGNLYGTTVAGGSGQYGTVFQLTASGALTTLHSFSGTDGANPTSSLTPTNDGSLYGTTAGGGTGNGTVFRFVPCTPCTITSISSSVNPSIEGNSVTLTATVIAAPGPNQPTGTVAFTDGGSPLGTVTLSGGAAALSLQNLSFGSHSIAAAYSGDTNFNTSGGNLVQVVNQQVTTTSLSSTANPASYDQSVTLTAQVTPANAMGSVTFTDGGTSLGSVVVSGGAAALTTALSVGTHSIIAAYSGNATLAPSSGTLSEVVGQASTSLVLASGSNPAMPGQQVTFSAAISSSNGGSPTGTVTFSQNGTATGSPVVVTGGQATITLTLSASGSYIMGASYSGDANYQASNNSLTEVVGSQSQSPLTTLYSFAGPDGSDPSGQLTLGTDGNFYGTTQSGGSNSAGTIFNISASGLMTTLYSFAGPDGSGPYSSLTQGSDGNFYGTTSGGGADGDGTVFQVTPAGVLVALHSFSGTDGSAPKSALILGADGNLYGTTSGGGSEGYGAIFKISLGGVFSQLYSFQGTDGSNPVAALTLGTDGNFYGSTVSGGANGDGTVFKITPAGALTSLYNFAGTDGSGPSGLALGTDGNFYGTTVSGGANATYGTVFKISPSGALTTIYDFAGTDGSGPQAALLPGSDGSFYSTTQSGGASQAGTVFSITPSGSLQTLYTFAGPDGNSPAAGLALGSDGNFYGTTSAGAANGVGSVWRLIVSPAFSNVLVSSGLTPSPYGAGLTITAAVSSGYSGIAPTGSVVFQDSGTPLGTAPVTNGTASLTIATLSPGTHSISATYGGDGNFKPSSGTLIETIGPSTSAVTVISTQNPSTYGQSVSLTANVAPVQGLPTPTGTLRFTDGSNNIGSAPLAGGSGSITLTGLTGGTHLISAAYSGDTNYSAGGGTLSQVVSQAQSAVKVVSNASSPSYGQSVLFTATVTAVSVSGTPTGTVTFTAGATTLGTATLSGNSAALTSAAMGPGSQTVTAIYSGDSNFQTNSSSVAETVGAAPTSTVVSSSQNPSSYDQPITLTVTVNPPAGTGPATGTVTFTKSGTTLGTATLSGGVASISNIAFSVIGTQTISAAYGGSSLYKASSGTLSQSVKTAPSTVTVVSSQNPTAINTQIELTATVTGQYGGSPTGTVTFSQNGVTLGSAKLSSGKAAIGPTFSAAGTYSITAVYSGDSNFAGSTSSPLSEQVTLFPTKTTVKSSNASSTVGNAVTFTATVAATSKSIPNGEQVTFYNGTAVMATESTTSGVATLTTSALPVGSYSITATYAGDSTLSPSTSAAIQQVINYNVTKCGLSSTPNPVTYPQSVTFTATVTSAGPTPTGKIIFKNGMTAIGSVTLASGSAVFVEAGIPAGTNPITAAYSGDSYNATCASSAVNEVVNPGATVTALSSSKNPSTKGTSVTFTATVTASSAIPTGTVTFSYGSTTLASATLSGGKAAISTSALPSGTDTITATYAATTNFSGSSASLQQTVH